MKTSKTNEDKRNYFKAYQKMYYSKLSSTKRKQKIQKQIEWNQKNLEKCCGYVKKYQSMNQIKKVAREQANSIECPSGYVRHHWSYDFSNHLDIIILTRKDHSFIHRHLKYVPEKYCFESINGIILDTKEKHQYYINILLDFKDIVIDFNKFFELLNF